MTIGPAPSRSGARGPRRPDGLRDWRRIERGHHETLAYRRGWLAAILVIEDLPDGRWIWSLDDWNCRSLAGGLAGTLAEAKRRAEAAYARHAALWTRAPAWRMR